MSIGLVIFDMDGVLINSYPVWFPAHQKGCKMLGYELTKQVFEDKFWGSPFPKSAKFITDDQNAIDEAAKCVRDTFIENIEKVQVFDGVKSTIENILKKNIKVGVVSNTPTYIVEKVLKTKGINYDYLVAPPKMKPKPNSEGIDIICNMANVKKENVIFIGDTDVDKATGTNASVKTLIIGKDIQELNEILKQI